MCNPKFGGTGKDKRGRKGRTCLVEQRINQICRERQNRRETEEGEETERRGGGGKEATGGENLEKDALSPKGFKHPLPFCFLFFFKIHCSFFPEIT